mmetsp:Transcript_22922/g.57488  ORF Transcript_22922/g.57488 Transcript_22922/m.57488 type:complete len:228 (+) Transcript_22922:140-823(+)
MQTTISKACLRGAQLRRQAVRRHARARSRTLATRCESQASPSSHGSTSPLVKGVVSGLTAVVNLFGGAKGDALAAREDTRAPITPERLRQGVEEDFTENGYLWSGQIDPDLYAYDCVFTDPTLSFTGLDTFERNIANLQPWLERLLRNERCELLGLELDEGACEVRASWLMAGDVALPWSPHVELTGRTRFRYNSECGGRVTEYLEEWDIPASEAVLQLLRPGRQPA